MAFSSKQMKRDHQSLLGEIKRFRVGLILVITGILFTILVASKIGLWFTIGSALFFGISGFICIAGVGTEAYVLRAPNLEDYKKDRYKRLEE